MTKYIKVLLSGIDVTAFVRSAIKTTTYGDAIATYEIELTLNANDLIPITNSLSVLVYLDSSNPPTTCVFNGFIDNFKPEAGKITLSCKDQLAKLINKQANHIYNSSVPGDPSYPLGKLSGIFRDLVETYGGLSTNGGLTVQDSRTDIVLTQFDCINADPFERCQKLAESLNWVFYYRSDTGFVYFEPKNFTTNPNTLTVGSNVIQIPEWEYDRSEMINDLRLEGAQQLVQGSETFTGSGSANQAIVLAHIPDSVILYYNSGKNFSSAGVYPANADKKVGDITGSLTNPGYYIDAINKKLTLNFTASNSTGDLLAIYNYFVPIPIHMINDESVNTYTTYAKTVTLTDVTTLTDAWKRGQNILDKYSKPFKSTKLRTLWSDSLSPQVGQAIQVIDSINSPNINEQLSIFGVVDYWPQPYTDIKVGDKQYTIQEYQSNVLERVKRLEESAIGPTNAVTEIVQPNITFNIIPDTTVVNIQLVNDSFIVNHTINGIIYGAGEMTNLEDFEATTGWATSNCTVANDSTAGHYWIGTQGLNASWTGAVTATITKTITTADIHLATGQNTGTPTQGTIGLWCYAADATKITSISLKIGSTSGNYATYSAETYAHRNSITGLTTLQTGLNYLLFDLNSPTLVTGTPNWVSTAYAQITIVTSGTSNATFDYLTSNKSNDLGQNGLDNRSTTWTTTTYTW